MQTHSHKMHVDEADEFLSQLHQHVAPHRVSYSATGDEATIEFDVESDVEHEQDEYVADSLQE